MYHSKINKTWYPKKDDYVRLTTMIEDEYGFFEKGDIVKFNYVMAEKRPNGDRIYELIDKYGNSVTVRNPSLDSFELVDKDSVDFGA